ncbi:uncharacterized protein METZ01_LOCUS464738 [marine metagenome]|uniref:Uncharacterized protein n=1 Tax=marine metagenome TaxID=408172 RepID=A0A383AW52_9ZZZZ
MFFYKPKAYNNSVKYHNMLMVDDVGVE